jgi:fibronectin-binding autotransporter adhesin
MSMARDLTVNETSSRVATKARHSKKIRLAVLSAAIAMSASQGLFAANGSWIGPGTAASLGGNNTWSVAGNWDTIPGSTAGAAGTSTDIAGFAGSPATITESSVVVDPNRNVAGFNFDVGSDNFAVGIAPLNPTDNYSNIPAQNTLYLSNGGVTQVPSSVTAITTVGTFSANVADIFAPIALNGNSYTFEDFAPQGVRAGLRVRNNVTPAPGVTGTVTVFLDGSQGSTSSSDTEMHGVISDSSTAVVSVVKNGPGTWEMDELGAFPNTYSGDTVINNGAIRTTSGSNDDGLGGLSAKSNYIINPGGLLKIGTGTVGVSTSFNTARSITLNDTGSLSPAKSTIAVILANNQGAALTVNNTTGAGLGSINLGLFLQGTTPMQGGITYVGNTSSGTFAIGASTAAALDLGTVLRPFNIGQGATSATTPGSFDLQVGEAITGGSATGGIVKQGPGYLRIGSPSAFVASPFTGKLEIQAGTVNISGDNGLTGLPDLVIDGGALNVNGGTGANQTFNTVTMSSGTIVAGSSSTSTVKALSFNLNVASPNTVASQVIFADSSAPASLTKTGDGKATLSGNSIYTGGTTISGGTLELGGGAGGSSNGIIAGNVNDNANLTFNRTSTIAFAGNITGNGSVAQNGPGQTTLSGANGYSGPTIVNSGRLILGATAQSPVLTGAGGAIVNAGTLEFDYSAGGPPSDPATQIQTLLHTTYTNNPNFSSGPIRTTNAPNLTRAIGWRDEPANSLLLVRNTYAGDTDLDGVVGITDFNVVAANFGKTGQVWTQGDSNYDGTVNLLDLNAVATNFGQPALSSPVVPLGTLVPEPASLGLIGLGVALGIRRRRR